MCGIAGILSLKPTFGIEKTILDRMVSAIAHRGPDRKGSYLDNWVGLGHSRLSIVDIEHGIQPMPNEDHTIWICCNGEIYNHLDHRDYLESKGHHFKTKCDIEIILHLYEENGNDCVEFLNGMFAFAIWDAPKQRLLLARDHMGIKPLYYAKTESALLFASEAKALFASGLIRPSLDARSIDNFFSFTYPLQPRSMFQGVNQVLPAEEVVIERGRVSNRRYWMLHFEEPPRTRPIQEYAENLLSLLKTSVKRQLMSDVPVGAYLSGGIDSSIIVALMRNLNNSSLETFSIVYDDPRYDESHAIQVAARSLGVINHTMVAEPSLAASYPNILYHLEIPFRHPISIPYYHLSRFVREQGLKVVLTGEGSDENFGAYNVFVADKLRRIIGQVPFMYLRRLAYKMGSRLRGQSDSLEYLLKVHFEFPELLFRRYGTVPPWYYHWRMLDSLRHGIYSSTMCEQLAGVDVEEELVMMNKSPMNGLHPHNASIWLETQTRLPNWILLIGDRCSMAHGVETRVPYLDREVIDHIACLPLSLKLHGLTTKFILREAAKGLITKEILYRRKFPFSAPIGSWFFCDRPPAFVDEMLSEDSIRRIGIFDPQEVTKARALLASSVPGTFERLRLEYLVFGILGVQSLSVVMKSFI